VTHCGGDGKKKSRPCSAGKLWKRAEEFRRDDMHDAAGADLIRALLKSGIEVDFADKCERSLQWAIGSIRRQRERERRNAEEEAKAERRREEEREALAEAEERRREYVADFVKFGSALREALSEGGGGGGGASSEAAVGADGSAEIVTSSPLVASVVRTFVATGPEGGNWNETLQLIRKVPPSDKTVDVLLIEARCHEMLGNHKQAVSAAGRLISKAASHGPWMNGSPRMMAATLGANAAMQLGLSENAISFYQNVLKFDPEQERALKQYRGLKKVVKLLNKAEEQIKKGYNNAASGFVDDCLSAMRGLDVDSPLFRSKIQLKQCTILSGMGKQEEALDYCDKAVDLRLESASLVSPALRKEAHLVRAEALLLDMDYDDAVGDFRAAFDLVPEDQESAQEKHELKQRLQQAMHQQQLWNGGTKDQRYNEHTGYPDGRPPERDHAKILQLPIDLDQRTHDVKCAWLKKQFKALVRQYHPDKYKGNKRRGSRKFKEVKEAKEIISSAWDC
jgi:tetratricopeptide (TPR) repeat protein